LINQLYKILTLTVILIYFTEMIAVVSVN